jgi:multiple sugar transport system substrate-binding protein
MSSHSPSEGSSDLTRRRLLAGAGLAGVGAVLAACGSSTKSATPATTAAGAATTAAGAATTAAAAATTAKAAAATTAAAAMAGKAKGDLSFGSNFSNDKPKAALQAMVDGFANKDVKVKVNTTDHNTFQDGIVQYLQQPDDVISWFAGYRMQTVAAKGLIGDISDVWAKADGLSDAFKKASTAADGKQYFMPLYYYPWGVHYKKSLFAEKGYKVPVSWDEWMALLDKMKTDKLTPLVAANDGKWPQMGMFDQLNMRTNGYDFHVSLMAGKEKWTDDRVMNVFKTWEKLIPFQQAGANGRKWEEGAAALGAKEAGLYLIGTFLTGQYKVQADIDDIDFFAFPTIDAKHGQDAVEAPIDGFMMAAKPKNPEAAKEFLAYIGTGAAQENYLKVDPSAVAANSKASTANYSAIQKKSAEFVGKAKQISQFLDRDTDPTFVDQVKPVLAGFLEDPKTIGDALKSLEEKKAAIFKA